jgi:hypothetical protein
MLAVEASAERREASDYGAFAQGASNPPYERPQDDEVSDAGDKKESGSEQLAPCAVCNLAEERRESPVQIHG